MVVIGGGTGLATLLRGLKRYLDPVRPPALRGEALDDTLDLFGGHAPPRPPPGAPRLSSLTAVVTVSDDGGSSGRLRRELGVLPPGDIRNCLVALSEEEDLLSSLFQYRFPDGGGLTGHSFGNLFLTALTGITGDFYQAVLTAERVLSVRGRILPASLTDIRLRGLGRSGATYEGESAIGASGEPLEKVTIEPAHPPAFPPAVTAIRQADLVLLGPGSLYTSVLANLLIPGIVRAVAETRARVILPLNLMTQPGETDDMDAMDHWSAFREHLGYDLVDVVLANSTPLPPHLLEYYSDSGSEPVRVERDEFAAAQVELVEQDLLAEGELIRHDPGKLARAVVSLLPEGADAPATPNAGADDAPRAGGHSPGRNEEPS